MLKCWHSMPSKKASSLHHPNHYSWNFRYLWRFVDKSKLKGERRVLTIITRSGSITGCYHKLLWDSRHDGNASSTSTPTHAPFPIFNRSQFQKSKQVKSCTSQYAPPLSPKREKRNRHVIFTYRNFKNQNKSKFLQVHNPPPIK